MISVCGKSNDFEQCVTLVLQELLLEKAAVTANKPTYKDTVELNKKMKRFAGNHKARLVFNKYKAHRANKLKY